MLEAVGDIFDYLQDPTTDAICIFTNGITNRYGQAMAGAGQAGAASNRWWNFRSCLGAHLKSNGNVVGLIGRVDYFKDTDGINKEANMLETYFNKDKKVCIVSFPTKEHFNKPSIPELITKSTNDLVKITDELGFKRVVLGRPGCGRFTGKLNWMTDVKPLIESKLDDRFIIAHKE